MNVERRADLATAEWVREAIALQRRLGFEPAFMMLRARGLDVDLARAVLALHLDRRLTRQPLDMSTNSAGASTSV